MLSVVYLILLLKTYCKNSAPADFASPASLPENLPQKQGRNRTNGGNIKLVWRNIIQSANKRQITSVAMRDLGYAWKRDSTRIA